MTINPVNIDHACLWVRSLALSKTYYEQLFGFTCRLRHGDATTLVVESSQVHFFISENTGDDVFIAKQHLSFAVANLDEVIDKLRQSGITDYTTGQVDFFSNRNYKWCEWRDPDGIRLECVEYIG